MPIIYVACCVLHIYPCMYTRPCLSLCTQCILPVWKKPVGGKHLTLSAEIHSPEDMSNVVSVFSSQIKGTLHIWDKNPYIKNIGYLIIINVVKF